MLLTGAQILIQSLIDQGVDTLFGYPGGAVLNIYDELYKRAGELRHILVSHEQGAAHAADGYARSTGKTGVALATSGPGATNLVTGIATAYHDSVPLVAITGNVTLDLIGRDSFQEVDIVSITNPIVKHNFFVTSAAELSDTIRQAFEIANSGRRGPVLVDIPKDITAAVAEFVPQPRFTVRPNPQPEASELDVAAARIDAAKRPLIYCGGGVTFTGAAAALGAFAERIQAPVVSSMMGLGSIPANSPLNLGLVGMHGTPAANMAVGACDLLITVGARFSDRVAGNRAGFAGGADIIHIDIDRAEISKNVTSDISLVGGAGDCLAALQKRVRKADRSAWLAQAAEFRQKRDMPDIKSAGGVINPREVITTVGELALRDAIIVTDVGQHQMYVAQYYPFAAPRTFLSSCGLGTMGYGMGAANGAAVGNPGRHVVLFTGDGSFHMNLAELAVAVSQNLKILVIIMNNSVLGMVHQWQKLFYDGRYSSTELDRKTDYVKLAEAFGARGLRLTNSADIRETLAQALATDGPCVIDCQIPPTERVFPIIPPGGGTADMIFGEGE
ncbi:MAG: biosynthetic-type acetolactate synthase large subunit [Oscillospiraceae bacterium]|jgi:acetolactate synthase-1/2/3 large subunit|nr:biosynthetic-type acetolactate synthase large subunit [Oscillospiraceae bacterium]